ncbi:MAG: type II toxin-antitoxin system RelE/ParE family toxin [Desulfamplus sp.]|nr:type II toxin-antitoxin system RelE/ParE family toxin [Desulfamplus sp.]
MKVAFKASFARDLKHIKDKRLFKNIQEVIETTKNALDISTLQHLKKMQGHDNFYRIRSGDHRIGIELVDDQIVFIRVLHRKDVYRYFP